MQHRRRFLRNISLTGTAVILHQQWASAITPFDSFKIRMLTDHAGIFNEKGGTILFYLSPKGNIIVDAAFRDCATHLIDEIKKKNFLAFDKLINTHHHGDHTAGNIAFKGLVKNVVAHTHSKENQERVAKEKNNTNEQLFPDTVFDETWRYKAGKEIITASYYGAGHTNGDAVIYFKNSGIAHVGDLVFNRKHPHVDTSAGANITSWIQVLDKIVAAYPATTKYICGHAADGYDVIITTADILAFKNYLSKVLAYTKEQIAAGRSKEDILKITAIPGAEEWKGDGIERPLEAAFLELSKP